MGITSQTVFDRWQNGKHYERHKDFYKDIKRYGWDSFTHEVLHTGLTAEQAKQKEEYYINFWDLLNSEKGYNKSSKANAPKLTEQSKAILSEKNLGEKNPFYNHKHTKQTKELMSKNRPKKRVMCVNTGIYYVSIREAERQTGAYHGDISKCCKGKLNIAGGLKWKYA